MNLDVLSKLEIRVQELESRAELSELMARYSAAADRKYDKEKMAPASHQEIEEAADEQAECFAHDGIWYGGDFGGKLVGRREIARFFCNSPWRFAFHLYASPKIFIDGEKAYLEWNLVEIACKKESDFPELIFGRVNQVCMKTSDGWKIYEMEFMELNSLGIETKEELKNLLGGG